MAGIAREDETLDEIRGVKIIQKKKGYRFSMDSLLLADFGNLEGVKKAMDLGTGSAIIAILLAKQSAGLEVTGVEVQDNLSDLARRNIELSSLSDRVKIIKEDIRMLKDRFEGESFDLIVSNPPYYPAGKGRIGPSMERTVARHEVAVTMTDIIEASSYLLRGGGRVAVIYPAGRLKEVISEMREQGIGPKRIRKAYTSEAEIVLIEGEKGYEGELLEEPSLYL